MTRDDSREKRPREIDLDAVYELLFATDAVAA
jgi:hypothetical protein